MDNVHLRHVLYFFYQKQGQKKNASEAAREICAVYGQDVVTRKWAAEWFSKFSNPNFDIQTGFDDAPRPGRPQKLDTDELEELLEEDSGQTTRQLAHLLEVDHSTIVRRLNALGKVWKAGKWVPHKLTEVNKAQRLNTCVSLLARQKKKSFLHKIVTGDESWIYYESPKRKKHWLNPGTPAPAQPKPNLHRKKALLCVWWDLKGILYYELLPEGQTVNADLYSNQLRRLHEEIERKRPFTGKGKRPVILLHDNARPHVAKTTRQAIEELGWEVLAHPAYSPDLAPSDYHLFLGLKNSLRDTCFKTLEESENAVSAYFRSKDEKFYWNGIHELPKRWQMAIAVDGDYFD